MKGEVLSLSMDAFTGKMYAGYVSPIEGCTSCLPDDREDVNWVGMCLHNKSGDLQRSEALQGWTNTSVKSCQHWTLDNTWWPAIYILNGHLW